MTILLNNEKLIFIKGSKVAGSSFELALSKFSQKNDIVTPLNQNEELIRKELNYPSPKNYHYKLNEMLFVNRKAFIKKILNGKSLVKFETHETASEIKKKLPNKIWATFSKLAIVRNPYTFTVSAFYWANRSNTFDNINNFVEQRPDVLDRFKNFYFIDNVDVVDKYLKFENLKNDIIYLEKEHNSLLGLSNAFEKFNLKKGIKPNNLDEISLLMRYPALIDKINNKMKYFFERFNYKMIQI